MVDLQIPPKPPERKDLMGSEVDLADALTFEAESSEDSSDIAGK